MQNQIILLLWRHFSLFHALHTISMLFTFRTYLFLQIKNILELDSLFSSEDYFIESCSVEDEPLPQDGLNWMVETLISRTE